MNYLEQQPEMQEPLETVPIRFPYLRRKRRNITGLRIEVAADSMRVGKTTAVEVLAEELQKRGQRVTVSLEDWQHNPFLKASYEDPEKNFLESQKWFIRRKWEQVRDGAGAGIFIQDVAPEMDFCYAATNAKLGRMSPRHFADYESYYKQLDWDQAPIPDIMVYLMASDDVLIKRAMGARREFETVDERYFLEMKRVNRGWLENASEYGYRILEIDTDVLNFKDNEVDKVQLANLVWQGLQLT